MRKTPFFLAALLLGGCARFPKSGSQYRYTRLRFTLTFASDVVVDQNFGYYVVIRRILGNDSTGATDGPVPVVTSGVTNGFVAGGPTTVVKYDPLSPTGYTVGAFPNVVASGSDATDADPGIPVLFGPTLTGVDPAKTTDALAKRQISFEITTEDLARNFDGSSLDDIADSPPGTQFNITGIQFDFIAQNLPTTAGNLGDRGFDALGDPQHLNASRFTSLQTSRTIRNVGDAIYPYTEGPNDVYGPRSVNPPIDLVDYEVTVTPPKS